MKNRQLRELPVFLLVINDLKINFIVVIPNQLYNHISIIMKSECLKQTLSLQIFDITALFNFILFFSKQESFFFPHGFSLSVPHNKYLWEDRLY